MKHNNIEFPSEWYHGTNVLFERFSLDYLNTNYSSSFGLYFTTTKMPPPYASSASEYAVESTKASGGHPYIYTCKISCSNPFFIDSDGWYNPNSYIDLNKDDIKRWTRRDNNDCVIAYDLDNNRLYDSVMVVLDPSKIRISKVEKLFLNEMGRPELLEV